VFLFVPDGICFFEVGELFYRRTLEGEYFRKKLGLSGERFFSGGLRAHCLQ